MDSEGKNHWKFESSKDPTRFDVTEKYIFWLALIAAPVLWLLFIVAEFLTFKWEWMVVAILGGGMSLANLYGYLRCTWNNTTEMSNYFTKLAFLSVSVVHSTNLKLFSFCDDKHRHQQDNAKQSLSKRIIIYNLFHLTACDLRPLSCLF